MSVKDTYDCAVLPKSSERAVDPMDWAVLARGWKVDPLRPVGLHRVCFLSLSRRLTKRLTLPLESNCMAAQRTRGKHGSESLAWVV